MIFSLPKPSFQVVQLDKLVDVDGKHILHEYTNALLLKLIRLKAFPTLNQENPYAPQYLKTLDGFILIDDGGYFLINPEEYEGQRLVCVVSFQEKLDMLQKSKYRQLLSNLFGLQPQSLVSAEEDRNIWKTILGKNVCDII